MRDAGAGGMQSTEPDAAERDLGGAGFLEQIGGAGEVLRDAFARRVQDAELRAA